MSAGARERILDACERVIARGGLSRFRMSAVANEAGVSIGLLSYHFGDRDGLLQAALDHVNAGTTTRAAATPDARTARDRLAALLCSEFVDDDQVRAGSTAWNELRAAAVFDADRAAALARSTSDWQSAVRELVVEAAREASAADDDADRTRAEAVDADALALLLTALVEGLSGRWLTDQITADEAHASLRATLSRLL